MVRWLIAAAAGSIFFTAPASARTIMVHMKNQGAEGAMVF